MVDPDAAGARWHAAQELFHRALDRPAEERGRFLDAECGGDEPLRHQVQQLLAADDEQSDFMRPPRPEEVRSLLVPEVDEPRPGDRIGSWQIVRELARGGMGIVYLAERADEQFQQTVALKVIRRSAHQGRVLDRFRAERQTLARLQHPYIARLLDGGTGPNSTPYLVMEYIEGVPIDRSCDEGRLDVAGRLRLFLKVCEAVSYAHRNLVVHRDLKPSNILVTAEAEPKLLDFGIAKVLEQKREQGLDVTEAGYQPMTPEYASPEQVRGEPVTTATDVYALGVLLYELLSGHRPYRLQKDERYDLERAICEEVPDRPSTVVASTRRGRGGVDVTPEIVGERRNMAPAALRRHLTGDLDNIVLMAIHKRPERRYPSVDQLAEDLRRYLEDRPVLARGEALSYRAAKFLRRNRVGVLFAALLMLTLVIGILMVLRSNSIALEEAARADRAAREQLLEARRFRATRDFLEQLLTAPDPGVMGPGVTMKEILDGAEGKIVAELAGQPEVELDLRIMLSTTYAGLGLGADAEHHLRAALSLLLETAGEDDPMTARTRMSLAQQLANQGRYEEAEYQYQQSLSVLERVAPDSQVLPDLLSSYGLLYTLTEDMQRSEALQRQALELCRSRPDHDPQDRAYILGRLATTLISARLKLDEAAQMLEEAIAIFAEAGNEPSRLAHLMGLGRIHYHTGRFERAREIAEQVLEQQRDLLGEGHLDLPATLDLLGKVLLRMNEPARAEQVLREALEIHRSGLDDDHPQTAARLGTLAAAVRAQGRIEEARQLFEDAIRRRTARFGEVDQGRAVLMQNVAALEMSLRRHEPARVILLEVLEILVATVGEIHPDTATVRVHLANSLLREKRFEEAAPYMWQGLEVLRQVHPPDHPQLVGVLYSAARLAWEVEDWEFSAELAQEYLDFPEGTSPVRIKRLEGIIGSCRLHQDRLEEAELWLVEAFPWLMNRYGAGDEFVALLKKDVQLLCDRLGRVPEQLDGLVH